MTPATMSFVRNDITFLRVDYLLNYQNIGRAMKTLSV